MKKILLITALFALMSADVNAGNWWERVQNHWRQHRWEQRDRCPNPTPVNVPDGGATATLLGLACAGIYIVKRKTRS